MPTPTVQHLELDRINAATDVQPRVGGVKEDVVDQYAEDMKAKAAFPPIVAYFDGSAYWLSEGFHRFAARRRAGFPTIAVEVRDGTKDDAHWNALGSNKDHGLRRTNEDKRQAVQLALAKRPDLSDRAIAEHVGVSNTFVGNVRGQLSTVDSSTGKRVGMDGKRRPAGRPGRPKSGSSKGSGKARAATADKPRPATAKEPTTKDQPLKDGTGADVPGHLRDHFGDPWLYNAMLVIKRILGTADELAAFRQALASKGNSYHHLRGADILKHLDAGEEAFQLAAEAVIAGMPFTVCPACGGDPAKMKTCTHCIHEGMVPEWKHNEARTGVA